MRIFILFCLFLSSFYFFSDEEEISSNSDYLTTKTSSIRKPKLHRHTSSAPKKIIKREIVSHNEEAVAVTEDYEAEDEVAVSDDMDNLPWADIEEGWKNELKDYLVSLEPEMGEEMFNAYLEEKKRFTELTDEAMGSYGTEELFDGEAVANVEYDAKYEELGRLHRENLQEIFGDYFENVEYLHKDYMESVQYLSRSDLRFNIAL